MASILDGKGAQWWWQLECDRAWKVWDGRCGVVQCRARMKRDYWMGL